MGRLEAAVRTSLGDRIRTSRRLLGGDMSDVFRLDLASGHAVVAKCGPLVAAEARMLQAIYAAGAPTPNVLGIDGEVLLIEALDETAPSPAGWQALGRGLAQVHAATGSAYGWPEDYAFGQVRVVNEQTDTWPDFWATRRLLMFQDSLPLDLARRIDSLTGRLSELLPRSPRPALLHGDLWTGNVVFSGDRAFLIDPACYYGDPEVDLAFLQLFGSPSPEFSFGYGTTVPTARHPVYQLWPALVHLRLFGASYRGLVEACLTALKA